MFETQGVVFETQLLFPLPPISQPSKRVSDRQSEPRIADQTLRSIVATTLDPRRSLEPNPITKQERIRRPLDERSPPLRRGVYVDEEAKRSGFPRLESPRENVAIGRIDEHGKLSPRQEQSVSASL